MAKGARIRPEQITRAKKILQDLPEKDDRKTNSEAAKLLEKDFKKAFQKGYTPKEIASILKNAGIHIPAYLVKNFLTAERKKTRHLVSTNNMDTPLGTAQITITQDTSDEDL